MPLAIVGEGERGPREEERWSGAMVDEGEEPREEERRGAALVGEREREREAWGKECSGEGGARVGEGEVRRARWVESGGALGEWEVRLGLNVAYI